MEESMMEETDARDAWQAVRMGLPSWLRQWLGLRQHGEQMHVKTHEKRYKDSTQRMQWRQITQNKRILSAHLQLFLKVREQQRRERMRAHNSFGLQQLAITENIKKQTKKQKTNKRGGGGGGRHRRAALLQREINCKFPVGSQKIVTIALAGGRIGAWRQHGLCKDVE
jgi:hypothetical protein